MKYHGDYEWMKRWTNKVTLQVKMDEWINFLVVKMNE